MRHFGKCGFGIFFGDVRLRQRWPLVFPRFFVSPGCMRVANFILRDLLRSAKEVYMCFWRVEFLLTGATYVRRGR